MVEIITSETSILPTVIPTSLGQNEVSTCHGLQSYYAKGLLAKVPLHNSNPMRLNNLFF